MPKTYTLSDLVEFTKEEDAIIESLFNDQKFISKKAKPSKNVINNILNYSKALSIKKSESLDNIEIVLN